ncbi:MAG: LytR/AlgR family response regulator transcription factor [Gemmatimonadales bacterium]
MTIRAVIADDEPPARRKLRALLGRWPEIEIVGEAGDGLEAVAVVERHRPELLFLDIRMPELDGFEVLRSLDPERRPQVVFVTAYDAFAVRAFEVGAVDYVLKPVAPDRLATAVERAADRINRDVPAPLEPLLEAVGRETRLDRFLVRSLDRLLVIDVTEVRWIEAAGNYVKLQTASGRHLVRGTLRSLEARLDPTRFVRIHRSTLVALPEVHRFEPAGHGDYHAVLRSGDRLTLSRRFRDRLPPELFPA